MARKVITVTIADPAPVEGKTVISYRRDLGKVFVITEMPASQGESWATRCFLAMAAGGMMIPDDLMSSGMQGLAVYGLRALAAMRPEDALPLLREMMHCLQIIPNPDQPNVIRRLVDDGSEGEDIEEIHTRAFLRMEIFKLHTDFLPPVVG